MQLFNQGSDHNIFEGNDSDVYIDFSDVAQYVGLIMNGYHTPRIPKIRDVDTRFKAYILNNISDVPMYYITLLGDDHKYSGQEVKIISLMSG